MGNRKFDCVLFDFDGTVADTSPGIKEALNYAFEVNGMPLMTSEEMDRFIGPPLTDSFMTYCSVSYEKSLVLLKDFRKKYHTEGIDKFIIYENIPEALNVLRKKGIIVALATSKPEPMAVYILKKAGLFALFDFILGAELDGSLIKKDDIVAHLLENPAISGKKVLMVGDTEFDVFGAHKNSVPALYLESGFGKRERVMRENPEYTAKDAKEMAEFFETF